MSTSPPLAIVTGASAGIGLELARLAAADGYRTVLVARRREPLERLATELEAQHATRPIVVAVDLSEPDGPDRVMATAEGATVEMLINNAGFGTFGRFADTPLEQTLAMIDLNVRALTRLAGLCLEGMIERGLGYVMNVASTAGFMPGPGMAAYYATKAYVLSFSEAVARELSGTGVRVSALCPGPTRTEFQGVAGITSDSGLNWMRFQTASAVARTGYRGLKRGKPVVVTGVFNRATVLLPRLLPRRLTTAIVGTIQSSAS